MFRDFLDILHRNGLLVDIIAIKILINCIVVSVFMILYRGATGTKLGDLWQFLSSILIISVISYCVVEFFHWHLYITPTAFGFFGDVIVSKIVAKGFRENMVSGLFNTILSKISKFYMDSALNNKKRIEMESKSNSVNEQGEEDDSDAKEIEEHKELSEEVKKRLQRKRRTDRH